MHDCILNFVSRKMRTLPTEKNVSLSISKFTAVSIHVKEQNLAVEEKFWKNRICLRSKM